MKTFATENIRNLALIGQKGAGKTSLAEAILFSAKATTRLGRVEDGNTVFDFEPEEHKRVASVQTSVGHCEWKKHKINVLDTPGQRDFGAEANNAMAVAECHAIVVSASDGIDPYSNFLFKKGEGAARAVVINQMGRERADFDTILAAVKEQMSSSCVPVTLPIGKEDGFKGVVDLLELKAHVYKTGSQDEPSIEDVPGDMQDLAGAAREALLEEIAGSDEALMEKYLDSGELTAAEARDGLKSAIASGNLIPVFAVESTKNMGVHELLNTLVSSFPSPAEGRPMVGEVDGEETPIEGKADGDDVLVVFKTIMDQQSGKISIFKVVSGKAEKDQNLDNVNQGAGERLGAMVIPMGKKVEQLTEAPFGDIGAVAKLKETKTGDTLSSNKKLMVKLPELPQSQISFRVLPKRKGDEDKLGQSIQRVREEDPTLLFTHDELTGEAVLSGLGISHIDVALEKMNRKYGVEVEKKPPNVPYLETITKSAKNIEGKHKKQSGGRGQFGVCFINMSPRPRGEGYSFVDKIFGGAIPRQFIPAVDKGIQEAMVKGVTAGYPFVDFEIELIDGKYHDVDSSETAFKIAGSKGFQAAVKQAGPVILEPIMDVAVEVPEECLGDIMGDLNSRRGRIAGMDTASGTSTVKAQVPMAEMLTYAPDLKSMTAGRGVFSMDVSHYDPLPANLTDKVIAGSPRKPAGADEEAS